MIPSISAAHLYVHINNASVLKWGFVSWINFNSSKIKAWVTDLFCLKKHVRKVIQIDLNIRYLSFTLIWCCDLLHVLQ